MLNEKGYEVPDSTPVEIPSRLRMPKSRTEQFRAMIRQELSRQAIEQGRESFEEADDFDLPDGEPWMSPYENDFEPTFLESGIGGEPATGGEAKPPGDQAEPGEGAPPPAEPVTSPGPV